MKNGEQWISTAQTFLVGKQTCWEWTKLWLFNSLVEASADRTKLTVQSMRLYHACPPMVKNWFLFSKQASSLGIEPLVELTAHGYLNFTAIKGQPIITLTFISVESSLSVYSYLYFSWRLVISLLCRCGYRAEVLLVADVEEEVVWARSRCRLVAGGAASSPAAPPVTAHVSGSFTFEESHNR